MNKQFEKNRAYDKNPELIALFRMGDVDTLGTTDLRREAS